MQYFTKKQLKQRNWTQTAIQKFLGEPDLIKPNPVYKSGAQMSLYLKERVIEIEKSAIFKQWAAQSQKRKKASEKSLATKQKALLELVNSWKILVPVIKRKKVLNLAICHYNNFQLERENSDLVSEKSNSEFLERITVNYIRHQMTSYDDKLELIAGKVGIQTAYKVLNQKIYNAIALAYPYLKEACLKQIYYKEL